MKKKYNQLQELKPISRKSKKRWSLVIWCLILLILVNIATVYVTVDKLGYRQGTEFKAVVLVVNQGKVGTGFFVSERYILTAAHVAGDVETTVEISNEVGISTVGKVVASGYSEWEKFRINENQVRPGATPHDWALIELESPMETVEPLYFGNLDDVSQGNDVYMIGHPLGQKLTVTKGIISRFDENEVSTDGEIDPGFSGGPMILVEKNGSIENGMVIGIVVSSPEGITSVKNAVPMDVVLKKCSKAGYSF